MKADHRSKDDRSRATAVRRWLAAITLAVVVIAAGYDGRHFLAGPAAAEEPHAHLSEEERRALQEEQDRIAAEREAIAQELKALRDELLQEAEEATRAAEEEAARLAEEEETRQEEADTAVAPDAQEPEGEEPTAPPEPASEPQDTAQLARDLQTVLRRAGCYAGRVDGIWGPQSRRATNEFARHAGVSLAGNTPSQALLEQIRAAETGERVCPAAAPRQQPSQTTSPPRQTASCPAGMGRGPDGRCYRMMGDVLCTNSRRTRDPSGCAALFRLAISSRFNAETRRWHARNYECHC